MTLLLMNWIQQSDGMTLLRLGYKRPTSSWVVWLCLSLLLFSLQSLLHVISRPIWRQLGKEPREISGQWASRRTPRLRWIAHGKLNPINISPEWPWKQIYPCWALRKLQPQKMPRLQSGEFWKKRTQLSYVPDLLIYKMLHVINTVVISHSFWGNLLCR